MTYVQRTFRICYVCVTYVWRILDSLFVSTAYQRRTCGVSRVSMAYVLRMCYVRFDVVEYVLCIRNIRNILWRSKRIIMLLYTYIRFSEAMYQMFLTVRGAVQGSFRATLGVTSVYVHVVL